jgi:hypothetical protein
VSTLCDARIQQNNEKAPPGAVASRLPGTHDVMQPRGGRLPEPRSCASNEAHPVLLSTRGSHEGTRSPCASRPVNEAQQERSQ